MKNAQIALRPPSCVMRLPVLGAFCQTRISFMRALLRDIKNWQFKRERWDIDDRGRGVAVYRAASPKRVYSLVVYSHELPQHKRSDRVIADSWDATFTLFDGVPTVADIERMRVPVSQQEAGRNDSRQLVLSRANRSARLFDKTADCLAAGQQPPATELAATGYLMRTTAVYGNGKFGIADRALLARRKEFAAPFRAELLAVFMFRAFPADLVEHLAAQRSASATTLTPSLRRALGIGNSTGLGMAPFIVSHPILLHHWIAARETALARVRTLPLADSRRQAFFLSLLQQAQMQNQTWKTADSDQQNKITAVQNDLQKLQASCTALFARPRPWNAIYQWSENNLSIDGREALVSLLLEPHGELIDDLADTMAADETFIINGGSSVGQLHAVLRQCFAWAQSADFADPAQSGRFWYVSAEKQEPRLGDRYTEAGAALEMPLAVMRDAQALRRALAQADPGMPLAQFLFRYPQYRDTARRVQIAAQFPYSEIQDNLIAADMLPLDLLRCKLSFFGAAKFDPRSERWLRINMYQNAPYPHELGHLPADEWAWWAAAA